MVILKFHKSRLGGIKNSYFTRYTLQGRGAKHPLRPRPYRTFFLPTNSRIRDRGASHVTWRQVWVCRPIGPYPSEIWVLSQWSLFFKFWKKAPNRLQKRVRNGSPSVPLLSLKARFWRFYFSFFLIRENPCLKTPSVLSNVHPPIYQSQKSIISRTD